ncbi:MAG TPA: hypothetical protein VJH75_00050 [Patescibacteria group bacterium]|nr:hypothetical protein [Patescibacteria group bacterium]
MLSLRTRLFIIISVFVLLVLGISIALLISRKQKESKTDIPTSTVNIIGTDQIQNFNNNQTPIREVPAGTPIKPATSEEVEKNTVKNLARIFLERYGSYSTDSNYDNIRDLESLSTPSLWLTLKTRIGRPPTGDYSGSLARVYTSAVTEWSKDSSKVVVSLTQETEKNGVSTEARYSSEVTLKKLNGDWRVDAFTWVKE